MAATITQATTDNSRTIEDKVRALPANQGLNDNDMWVKVDTEVAQSITDSKYVANQPYIAANKHGKK